MAAQDSERRLIWWLVGGALAIAATAFAAGYAVAVTWRPEPAAAAAASLDRSALAPAGGTPSAEPRAPQGARPQASGYTSPAAPNTAPTLGDPSSTSVERALAWMAAQEGLEARELVGLVQAFGSAEPTTFAAGDAARLRSLVARVSGNRMAMERLARLGTPAALDILYAVWTARSRNSLESRFVLALLGSKELRSKTTPSLDLLLALSDEKPPCELVSRLLPQIAASADDRILPVFARFGEDRTCGKKGKKHCYQCLKTTQALRAAMVKAAQRKHPLR